MARKAPGARGAEGLTRREVHEGVENRGAAAADFPSPARLSGRVAIPRQLNARGVAKE